MNQRFFKCPSCRATTSFQPKEVLKPNQNTLVCHQCNKQWSASGLPACCGRIKILWVLKSSALVKPISSIQTYAK